MMIDIQNEEHYYSLPGLDPNIGHQHLPRNMIYRAMIYLCKEFTSTEADQVLEKLWGIKLSTAQRGRALRDLWELGYVKRLGKKSPYRYMKTVLYERELMTHLGSN